MKQILFHPYTRHFLIAAYGLMLGFSISYALIWVLPSMAWIPWPFSTFPGHIIGILISALVTFFIFEKWQAPEMKKVIVATVLLIILAILGNLLQGWLLYLMKMRAAEALGLL